MNNSFSFPKSQRHKTENDNPGPGAYVIKNGIYPNGPQAILGTESREQTLRDITPGPADYNPKLQKANVASISFGLKTEISKDKLITPGPGSYLKTSNKTEGPKYTMMMKYKQDDEKKKVPGPGAYNTNKSTMEMVPSVKMPQSKRDINNSKNDIPGPGSYNIKHIPKQSLPNPVFNKSKRLTQLTLDTPGPGTYSRVSSVDKKTGISISTKFTQKNLNQNNPGPGTYNILIQNTNLLNGKIGNAKRIQDNNKNNNLPGPGQYSDNFKAIIKKQPQYKIPQQPRKFFDQNLNPGPGNYNIPSQSISGPKYVFGLRGNNKSISIAPGPGQYNPNFKIEKSNSHQVVSFPKSQRYDPNKAKSIPGPGAYNSQSQLKKTNEPKYSFGNQNRNQSLKNLNLGPGAYNLEKKVTNANNFQLPKKK